MVTYLGITPDRLKIVDVISGSVIINFFVDSDKDDDT